MHVYNLSKLQTYSTNIRDNTTQNQSYTEAYQKHLDCGYGCKVVCCYNDRFSKPVEIYRGGNVVYKFMEMMFGGLKILNKQPRGISKNR